MKKILTLLSVLLFAVAVHAQKYLEVYRDGNVIGSMMATDVDSVRVTGDNASSRQIHFFAAGMHKAAIPSAAIVRVPSTASRSTAQATIHLSILAS